MIFSSFNEEIKEKYRSVSVRKSYAEILTKKQGYYFNNTKLHTSTTKSTNRTPSEHTIPKSKQSLSPHRMTQDNTSTIKPSSKVSNDLTKDHFNSAMEKLLLRLPTGDQIQQIQD